MLSWGLQGFPNGAYMCIIIAERHVAQYDICFT